MEVLNGALPIITKGNPNLIIEIEERHRAGSSAHIFAQLKALGYHGWFAWRDKLCEIDTFDRATHQSEQWPDALRTRRYNFCNNFIFSRDAKIAKRLENTGMLKP